jgi:hypothetical protein
MKLLADSKSSKVERISIAFTGHIIELAATADGRV